MSRTKPAPPLSARTRVVGIFGDPVEHSGSPAMHNAAFASLGLDYRYLAFRVRSDDLATATRSIRVLGIRGVNVTVPHKERVARFVDSVSEIAAAIGAVNTIVNDGGHLHGDNTDVFGFVQSLRDHRRRLRGRRAIVIGAGGASRAVLAGLRQIGMSDVLLANRTPGRARTLLARIGRHAPPSRVVSLSDLSAASTFDDIALVVNATSLGWGGERFPPIAIEASDPRCIYYDMAYGRATDFLHGAERSNRPRLDGTEMLIFQGARAFTLWTKRRAPIAAMRKALHTQISN